MHYIPYFKKFKVGRLVFAYRYCRKSKKFKLHVYRIEQILKGKLIVSTLCSKQKVLVAKQFCYTCLIKAVLDRKKFKLFS